MKNDQGFFYFWVFWMLLGLSGFLFFQFNKNTALKKKLFPVLTIVTGVIFGAYVLFVTGFEFHWFQLIFFGMIALITFLNIRNTTFCDTCGKMIYNNTLFSKQEFCSKCGANLS
jgi:hypothetical protein